MTIKWKQFSTPLSVNSSMCDLTMRLQAKATRHATPRIHTQRELHGKRKTSHMTAISISNTLSNNDKMPPAIAMNQEEYAYPSETLTFHAPSTISAAKGQFLRLASRRIWRHSQCSPQSVVSHTSSSSRSDGNDANVSSESIRFRPRMPRTMISYYIRSADFR